MKANRSAAHHRPTFRDDERGVSEAVGYIITFGISTIILVTSLQAFLAIQRHTGEIAGDRVVSEVAAQVAFAVDEALRAGSTYPDANFSMTLTVPAAVGDVGYNISLYSEWVWVEADNALPETWNATGEKQEVRGRARADFVSRAGAIVLCANPSSTVPNGVCSVRSGEGQVTIVYADPDGLGVGSGPGVYIKRVQ